MLTARARGVDTAGGRDDADSRADQRAAENTASAIDGEWHNKTAYSIDAQFIIHHAIKILDFTRPAILAQMSSSTWLAWRQKQDDMKYRRHLR